MEKEREKYATLEQEYARYVRTAEKNISLLKRENRQLAEQLNELITEGLSMVDSKPATLNQLEEERSRNRQLQRQVSLLEGQINENIEFLATKRTLAESLEQIERYKEENASLKVSTKAF